MQGAYLAWIFSQWQDRVMISIIAIRNFDAAISSRLVMQSNLIVFGSVRFAVLREVPFN